MVSNDWRGKMILAVFIMLPFIQSCAKELCDSWHLPDEPLVEQ